MVLCCIFKQFTLQFVYEYLNSDFCDFFHWRDCVILLVLYTGSKKCPLLYKIIFFPKWEKNKAYFCYEQANIFPWVIYSVWIVPNLILGVAFSSLVGIFWKHYFQKGEKSVLYLTATKALWLALLFQLSGFWPLFHKGLRNWIFSGNNWPLQTVLDKHG